MNRKTVALICASLIVACLACHGGSLNAQNYGGGSYYGSTYGGNVDVGTGGMSIPPADVMARSFSNGYGYGACSNPCYSSCYTGYSSNCYTGNSCGGCGLGRGRYRSWYHSAFGSDYCFSGCPTYGSCGTPYAYSGCGIRRGCGYRAARPCCSTVANVVVAPACCSPMPTCCGAVSSSVIISSPVVISPSPAPAATAAAAPTPTPEIKSTPTPTSEAPKPELEKTDAATPEAPKPEAAAADAPKPDA